MTVAASIDRWLPVGCVLTRLGISGLIFSHMASEILNRLAITDDLAFAIASLLPIVSHLAEVSGGRQNNR